MSYRRIRLEATAPVARVTMSWPEKRNALSIQMMEELTRGLRELSERAEIGAIILGAEGEAFSSGHYLPEMIGKDLEHQRRVFAVCVELMETVERIPRPVIAEVPGIATAAGCQLVATCDLAVASEEARFATPGVKIGLFCSTPMVAVSRAVGRKRAMEMLLTGETIDARTAMEWGLVNRVVARARLREEAERLAARITEASSFVVALGKRAFYTQIDLEQPKAYDYAAEVMSENAMAADAQEGMSAFLEKRKPCWAGSKTDSLAPETQSKGVSSRSSR
jgi:enoyl-CoA hydratase/carnithine racemase